MLVGWDIDGVLTAGAEPEPGAVVISGRTFAEYDEVAKSIAQWFPTYIRGSGAYGDHEHAGVFKATMITMLGVTVFHEDHPRQIEIIRERCPGVEIVQHPRLNGL